MNLYKSEIHLKIVSIKRKIQTNFKGTKNAELLTRCDRITPNTLATYPLTTNIST